MKILFAAPYVPLPPTFGGALRIYNLMKQTAHRHEISLVAYGTENEYELLKKEFGKSLKNIFLLPYPWPGRFRRMGQFYSLWTEHSFFHNLIYSDQMQILIDSILEEHHYHIVQSEFAVMGAFDFKTDGLKILDAHNVEYDTFRRMSENAHSLPRWFHYRREYQKFFREEILSCQKHDAIFVTSPRDKEILDHDVPSVPKFIIPNGVDTTYFVPSLIPQEEHSIVFTGMMGYVPNYDGIIYFLDEIFPHVKAKVPDAKIYVVGKQPPRALQRRSSPGVVITDYVEDVRPYVWKSSVYVVPLRMGGGTRLKVVEAMAMKIPIVTTSIGCEGIDVSDGETVLIRDEPKLFADAIVELFRNAGLRNKLIENGFDKVLQNYEWSVIGKEVEKWYQLFTIAGSRVRRDRQSSAAAKSTTVLQDVPSTQPW